MDSPEGCLNPIHSMKKMYETRLPWAWLSFIWPCKSLANTLISHQKGNSFFCILPARQFFKPFSEILKILCCLDSLCVSRTNSDKLVIFGAKKNYHAQTVEWILLKAAWTQFIQWRKCMKHFCLELHQNINSFCDWPASQFLKTFSEILETRFH